MTREFNLLDEGEVSSMDIELSNDLQPHRSGMVANRDREFSFRFEVEVDPRFVERVTGIDTHPMPPAWRDAHR